MLLIIWESKHNVEYNYIIKYDYITEYNYIIENNYVKQIQQFLANSLYDS